MAFLHAHERGLEMSTFRDFAPKRRYNASERHVHPHRPGVSDLKTECKPSICTRTHCHGLSECQSLTLEKARPNQKDRLYRIAQRNKGLVRSTVDNLNAWAYCPLQVNLPILAYKRNRTMYVCGLHQRQRPTLHEKQTSVVTEVGLSNRASEHYRYPGSIHATPSSTSISTAVRRTQHNGKGASQTCCSAR